MKKDKNSDTAPTFLKSFLENLEIAKRSWGNCAYIPFLFLTLCALPSITMAYFEFDFSDEISSEEYVQIFSSLIVFFGILAAFSIAAMTQVQTIASKYPFSDYLNELGILNSFIFYPQYTFVLQCLFTIFSMGLIFTKYIVVIPETYIDNIVAVNFGFAIYVLLKTLGLVNLIRLLTWHYANYEILYNKA